jgi:hypothetical protein
VKQEKEIRTTGKRKRRKEIGETGQLMLKQEKERREKAKRD